MKSKYLAFLGLVQVDWTPAFEHENHEPDIFWVMTLPSPKIS